MRSPRPLCSWRIAVACIVLIGPVPASAAPTPPEAGTSGTASMPGAYRAGITMADAGRQSTTIARLTSVVQAACDLEPWQYAFRARGGDLIDVQRSPTLSARQTGCIYGVVANSRFRATNDQHSR